MFTQNPITPENIDYYEDSYFFENPHSPGYWVGNGSALLGLSGEVLASAYKRLLDGYSPTNTPLVRTAGNAEVARGMDFVANLPKTASVFLAHQLGDNRQKAADLLIDAARPSIELLEQVTKIRFGAGGTERRDAKLVIAAFPQFENRLLEPHAHIHLVTMRGALTEDGMSGAIDRRSLYQAQLKMAMGALFRAEASVLMERRYFLSTVRDRFSFRVEGVPSEVADGVSTRRQGIEERLRLTGHKSAKAAQYATLATREPKEHVPLPELIKDWRQQLTGLGFGPEAAAQCHFLFRERAESFEVREKTVLETALQKMSTQKSYFTDLDAIRYVAEEAQGQGISGFEVLDIVERALDSHPEIVRQGYDGERPVFTTKEILALEKDVIGIGVKGKSDYSHVLPIQNVEKILETKYELSAEQKNAIIRLTTDAGGVQIVSGLAGTGKSSLVKALKEVYAEEGYQTFGTSITGKVAVDLKARAMIETDTIAGLLIRLREDNIRQQQGLPRRVGINAKSVLIVDEAATAGTRQIAELAREIRVGRGAKLVLIGDHRQSQSIEFGGAMTGLARRLGQVELNEIKRQKHSWSREVVKQFGEGDAEKALKTCAEKGFVKVLSTRVGAESAMVNAWSQGGITAPREHIMVTATRAEARRANLQAQRLTKEAGVLSEDFIQVGDNNFHVLDRVMFCENKKSLGVRNGQLGTVTELRADTECMVVQIDNGSRVLIPYKEYSHLQLGYALTTFKSQGVTMTHSYCLVPETATRELSVVQASRHSVSCTFFVDAITAGPELSEMATAMSKPKQQVFAHDITRRSPSYVVLRPEIQQ